MNKFFTFILVTIPITSMYKSFVPMLSIADVLLLILSFSAICDKLIGKKKHQIKTEGNHYGPILLILFFVFITLISMLIGEYLSVKEILARVLRYGLFMFTVSIVGCYYFDFRYAMRLITNISILATIYIILQSITYYIFGITLPFVIPFLTPVTDQYTDITFLIEWYNQFYYRPQSFFAEPAHFSQYVLIALTLCLYWKVLLNEKTRILSAIFFSIGLILSTSSIGIIMGAFIWSMYFLHSIKDKLTLKRVLLISVVVIVSLPFLFKIPMVKTAILRVFQTTARTSDSYSLFSNLDFQQKVIGVGLGNEDLYLGISGKVPFMNSITIVLLGAGYLGFTAYILFFINLIMKKKDVFRVISICLLILGTVSEVFFTYTGVLYLLYIYYGDKYVVEN